MNTRELRSHLAAGGVAVFDLGSRAKFQLTGADRVRYLNGQVSNDIRKLAQDTAMPACVMTAKGKMNALVWISAGAGLLQLDAESELREPLAARLERYIISDDALLEDTTDERRLFHTLGMSVDQAKALFAGTSPVTPADAAPAAYRSRRFGLDGVDLTGTAEAFASLKWPPGTLQVDDETAETFRIEQGIPRWGAELTENTIPVEAGLDAMAIDYHKGCYIGQEVISRIKSVGHVNRKLTGFVSDTPLTAGTALYFGEKEAGQLTSVSTSFALEKAVALGYLKRGIDATTLTAGQPNGILVEIRTLPLIA